MGSSSTPSAWERTDLSEAVLDGVGAAICVIDSAGRVVRWNQAATALTGISSDRVRGSVFLETLPLPSDIDEWKREFERISALPALGRFESRWRIHDGLLLSLAFSCSVVRDRAGKVQYFVCTFTDSLSREIMTDRSEELRYMSRFLHDTISQDLIALSYDVSYLEDTALDQPAQTRIRSALEVIDRCCRYIRVMSFMLAPPSPPEISLEASIGQYTDYMREEAGLAVTADIDPVPVTVRPETQLLLFAALQKWVVQGIRTRRKPRISVRLKNLSARTVLEMETLCDPPVPPADPRPQSSRAGWAVIRDRTLALGGEFHIDGDSSRVFAAISLPEFPDHEHR
jgi:PAS domain S-box-containing protein